MLTGQAKEDFEKWYCKGLTKIASHLQMSLFESKIIIEKNAYYISWFDSVGIYIDIDFFRKNIKEEPLFAAFTTDKYNGLQELRIEISSRTESTTAAIAKANEIYNIHIANSEQK